MLERMQAFIAWLVIATLSVATSQFSIPVLHAQVPVAPDLQIVILDDPTALNNIRARTIREPIVEVHDRNRRPVGGALVTFALPKSGAGGSFLNGSKVLTVTTDQNGQAKAAFRTNSHKGSFQMEVTASFQGLTASTRIGATTIAAGAAGGLFGIGIPATIAVVGAVAAATAVGIVKGVGGGGKATTVSVGTPRFP